MLIQEREDALRLIRQHDHALLAGALASAWRTEDGASLPLRTVLASALHDSVWRVEDARPRLDSARGQPFDFITIPVARKRELVEAGVRALAAVDAEVAALVQDHHHALAEALEVEPTSQLAWVRFFDNLSLFACLTPPGSLPSSHPRWLPSRFTPPEGPELTASWQAGTLALSPGAFSGPLTHTLAYRDLPGRPFRDADDLHTAWDAAPEQHWRIAIASRAP